MLDARASTRESGPCAHCRVFQLLAPSHDLREERPTFGCPSAQLAAFAVIGSVLFAVSLHALANFGAMACAVPRKTILLLPNTRRLRGAHCPPASGRADSARCSWTPPRR